MRFSCKKPPKNKGAHYYIVVCIALPMDHFKEFKLKQRRSDLEQHHDAFVAAHPEILTLLHDAMQAILVHKPDEPLKFMQKYFADNRQPPP